MAEKTSFSCGNNLDIFHVDKLKQRLESALERGQTIVLKADKVERVDTAGLQLIIALKKKIEADGGSIVWQKPTQTLLDIAKLLGVDSILELKET